MLKSLRIKNFQNHKKSQLNLSEGLNVIYGDNDQGKSAVLRALNWVVNNKPSGFGFQNKEAGNADTEVSLFVDDNVITRKRGKKENCYVINKNKFSALRSDIPNEVSDILNLSSFAYQSQFDSHFLFSDSPGEVAKKINQIVGLSEIDNVLSKARGIKDSTNKEVNFLIKRKEKLENDISPLSGVVKFEERVELLLKREKILDNKIDLFNNSVENMEEWEDIHDEINQLNTILFHAEKVNKLEENNADLSELIKEKKIISTSLNTVIYKSNELTIYHQVKSLIDQLEDLESKEKKLGNLINKKVNLDYVLELMRQKEGEISEETENIIALDKDTEKMKKKMKICPLCEKPF